MKRKCIFCAFALVLTACNSTVDLYQPETDQEEKGGLEYAERFSNLQEINLSIHTATSTYYALYTEYPYTEVDGENVLTATPVAQGMTPIDITVEIPKDVTKLYLNSWQGVEEREVADITVRESASASTRAESLSTEKLREVQQAAYNMFPELNYNFRREELYKCTDLVIRESEGTGEFETANVTLTYLGDGGFGSSGDNIKLYMYTYPTEKRSTLTFDDCTFYGWDSKTEAPVIITYDQMYNGKNPIYTHKSCRGKFPVANMGDFPKGLSVGFCMLGTRTYKLKFSTPELNPNEMYAGQTIIDKGVNAKARSSNTQELYYNDGKGDFTFDMEKHVASAFIQHYVASDGSEYNILGCDNTLPFELTYRADGKFQCSFDGDYNDFLAMVQTNPNKITPNETVIGEEVKVSSSSHGYYAFEDQFPNKGDFDFNDVIVEYKATHYENNTHEVSVRVVAKGCRYNNLFGFYDDFGRYEVLTGINGYENVSLEGPWEIDEERPFTTIYLTGSWQTGITPFLYNGTGEVSVKTYCTDDYPYVINIPYNEKTPFRWCRESQPIDEAYHFNVGKDWYLNVIDENLVIER